MAEIRRHTPVARREIYGIPTFGKAVLRKFAAQNQKVILNERTFDTVKWPGGCCESPKE